MAFAVICVRQSSAQSVDTEPRAVVELGGAAARSFTEARSSFGPTVAVEVTPIENWLELEAGVHHSSADIQRNGVWTFCSRNLGLSPTGKSLCLELVPSGFTPAHTGSK